MKNKMILLSLLTLLLVPMGVAFAGSAGPVQTPSWYNCGNQYVYVGSTSKAYPGTSNIVVAWYAPNQDAAGALCIVNSFSLMQFTVQVYHRGIDTAQGPTFQSSSYINSITISVVHTVQVCNQYGCTTHNYPYVLQTGDGVCVNEEVWYGVHDGHSGGFCYYV